MHFCIILLLLKKTILLNNKILKTFYECILLNLEFFFNKMYHSLNNTFLLGQIKSIEHVNQLGKWSYVYLINPIICQSLLISWVFLFLDCCFVLFFTKSLEIIGNSIYSSSSIELYPIKSSKFRIKNEKRSTSTVQLGSTHTYIYMV